MLTMIIYSPEVVAAKVTTPVPTTFIDKIWNKDTQVYILSRNYHH
jgi:hypothetical protein